MATPTPNSSSPPDAIYPRVVAVGETAFTVEFGNAVTRTLNRQVHALDIMLREQPIPGIEETVPTYRALLVLYDPAVTSATAMHKALTARAQHTASCTIRDKDDRITTGRVIEIPVHYGGNAGPDLEDVAAHCDISP
jgi:allophanate hydrolase subunit 1